MSKDSNNNFKVIDYKDIETLKRFVNPSAKIVSKRRSNLSAKNQRKVAVAIKRARYMGLLAFVAK